MVKLSIHISTLAIIALLSVGCISTEVSNVAHKALKFTKKDKGQEAEQATPDKPELPAAHVLQIPIGTVHMVDHVGKFILIKSSRTTSLEADTQIISYGPDARMSSHLKASPARKGAYLTADLVEGVPKVGDMVMMVKSMTNNVAKAAAGVAGMPGTGNVQVLE